MKNSVGDHGSINAHSHSNGTTAGNDAGDIPNSSREVPSDDEVAAESKSCRAVVQKQFQYLIFVIKKFYLLYGMKEIHKKLFVVLL